VVVAVLFSAGDHVPEIPLFEVVGSAVKAVPEHIGAIVEKTGIVFELFTVMVKVVVVAHCPALGVKV
jgi:hypothetical protein